MFDRLFLYTYLNKNKNSKFLKDRETSMYF